MRSDWFYGVFSWLSVYDGQSLQQIAESEMNTEMSVSDLYKELGPLTKEKDQWKERIPYVSSLMNHESVKIQAKAL